MVVTKAQLLVWALIAGLGTWGGVALSQMRSPTVAPAPSSLAVVPGLPAVAESASPVETVVAVAEAKPEPQAVAEFPFPSELQPGDSALGIPVAANAAADLVDVPPDAIPGIEDAPVSTVLSGPPALDELEPVEIAAGLNEEPPIPMPSRPLVTQPVKAVPLAEIRTLYVVADILNVRASPSATGAVLQKVPLGYAVAARQQADEWIGFEMQNGTIGWMRTDYLSDTEPPPVTAAVSEGRTEPLNLM